MQNTYKLQYTVSVGDSRKALIDIIAKLIQIANSDYKNESFVKSESKKELVVAAVKSNNSSHRSNSYTK